MASYVSLSVSRFSQGYCSQPDPAHIQTRWWMVNNHLTAFHGRWRLQRDMPSGQMLCESSATWWALSTDPYSQLWGQARTSQDLCAVLSRRTFIVLKATTLPSFFPTCWTDYNSFPPNATVMYLDQYHTAFVRLGQRRTEHCYWSKPALNWILLNNNTTVF